MILNDIKGGIGAAVVAGLVAKNDYSLEVPASNTDITQQTFPEYNMK